MATVENLVLRISTFGAKAAAAEVEGVQGATGGLGRTAKTAAGIAGLGGLAFGLKDITESAVKFQAQTAQLTGALRNMGLYSQENVHRIQEAADTLSTHGGFDPQTSIAGMTRLIAAHESVAQAIKNEGLVTDIARRAGISYQTALRAVMNVEQGRTTGLARLGIVVKPVTSAMDSLTGSSREQRDQIAKLHAEHKKLNPELLLTLRNQARITPEMRAQAKQMDKNATQINAMRELWKRFGGATKDFSATAAGAASNFKNTMDILGQRLGAVILPIITKVAKVLSEVANYFLRNKTAAEALGIALGALVVLWTASKIVAFVGWVKELGVALGIVKTATAETSAVQAEATAQMALFGAAEEGASIASVLLATAMWAIPIIAIIAGIVLLITHWKLVEKVMKDVVRWIVGAYHTIMHAIAPVIDFIKAHWKLMVVALTGGVGLLVFFVIKHFHQIRDVVMWVVHAIIAIWTTLIGPVKAIVSTLWTIMTWPFREVIRIAGTIWHGISGPLSSLASLVSGAMNSLWNILTWPFREAIKFAGTLWHAIQHLLGPLKDVAKFAGGVIGDVGGFLGLQHGGTPTHGGVFTVGEKGPERIYIPPRATVQPYQGAPSLAGAGAPVVEAHFSLALGSYEFGRAVAYAQSKAKATR